MSGTRQNVKKFLTASGAIALLDALRSIAVANQMGPELTGLCMTTLILPQVAQYLNMGLIESLTVLVPHSRAKQEEREACDLKYTVLFLSLAISLATFFGVCVYLVLFPRASAVQNQYVLMAGILIVLWEAKQFFVTDYIVTHRFGKLSRVELAFALMATAFQISMVRLWGGYGFWLGLILPHLIVISYAAFDFVKMNPHGRFTWPSRGVLVKIIPLGLSLLIASVTYAPFLILARALIARGLGVRDAGLFLLPMIIITKISIIPSAISKVLLPRFAFLHGLKADISESYSLFVKTQNYTLLATSCVILPGLFLLQPLAKVILPQYAGGVPAARMMLLAAIPYSLIDHANNFLLARQKKGEYLFGLILSLIFQTLLMAILFSEGLATVGTVSASFIAVFAVQAVLSNYQVYRTKEKGARAAVGAPELATLDALRIRGPGE